MRRGFVLSQILVYILISAASLALLAPLLWQFQRTAWSTIRAVEDLDGAGVLLASIKDDVRRARQATADGASLALMMEDGEQVLYRFVDSESGASRQAGEEWRAWDAGFENLSFEVRGRLVIVDLELRRREGGRLRPRLRAEVLGRNLR